MGEEAIIPIPPRESIAPLSRVRSTLLGSSYLSLKEHGHEAAYLAHVPDELHQTVQLTPAGVWLPVAVAEAHYAACDALKLSASEILAMGTAVAKLTQKSMVAMATTVASASGMTPWTIFSMVDRAWHRLYEGSAVGMFKLGPKEARFAVVAMPLARFAYWRVALRGIVQAVSAPFCRTIFVREVARASDSEVSYRMSWA